MILLPSIGVCNRLKFAVNEPGRELVVYEASVSGREYLGIDFQILVDKGCKVCRSIIWTCGHWVPDASFMLWADGQLRRVPSGFGSFVVVYRKVYLLQGEKPFSIKRKQGIPYSPPHGTWVHFSWELLAVTYFDFCIFQYISSQWELVSHWPWSGRAWVIPAVCL